jgi:hypothetical protein
MTLRVGSVYRGIWAGSPKLIGIRRIEILEDCAGPEHVSVEFVPLWFGRAPCCLWWALPHQHLSGEEFVARLRAAEAMAQLPGLRVRRVPEIEV